MDIAWLHGIIMVSSQLRSGSMYYFFFGLDSHHCVHCFALLYCDLYCSF